MRSHDVYHYRGDPFLSGRGESRSRVERSLYPMLKGTAPGFRLAAKIRWQSQRKRNAEQYWEQPPFFLPWGISFDGET